MKMPKKLIFVVIVSLLSFTTSGCVVLAGAVAFQVIRKASSGPPKLSEQERNQLEYRKIKGTKENVLIATENTIKEWDCKINRSDYEKGLIKAIHNETSLEIDASIEDFEGDMVGLRIVIKDKYGVVENKKIYEDLFKSVQGKIEKGEGL